jgi:hypothetical protein
MATATDTNTSDVAILSRLIQPERGDLTLTAARSFLKINFEQTDIDRMHALAAKAREGKLTRAEQDEITNYERVSVVLDMLHSKARVALNKHGSHR